MLPNVFIVSNGGEIIRGNVVCRYFNGYELIYDQMKCLLYTRSLKILTERPNQIAEKIYLVDYKAVVFILQSFNFPDHIKF